MASTDTKERILDAAEKLFGTYGFGGASVRAIASSAGVNLASINYHFGSKESLVQAVLERRVGPMNRERLELLDRFERASGDAAVETEQVVEAFIRPMLKLRQVHGRRWTVMRRLLGQTMSLPGGKVRDAFLRQFTEVVRRFTTALQRALPDLSEEEILWRLLFMVGTVVHTLAMVDDMPLISGGRCGETDPETTVRHLVPFIAAGLRAPAVRSNVEALDA